jgi:uncharacterized protein
LSQPYSQDLNWLITDFTTRVEDIAHAIVVSADGVPLAVSTGIPEHAVEKLAAIVSGLTSLMLGAARVFDGGAPTQALVELEGGLLFIKAISDGSSLAVLAAPECDTRQVSYEMTRLVGGVGELLTPRARAELLTIGMRDLLRRAGQGGEVGQQQFGQAPGGAQRQVVICPHDDLAAGGGNAGSEGSGEDADLRVVIGAVDDQGRHVDLLKPGERVLVRVERVLLATEPLVRVVAHHRGDRRPAWCLRSQRCPDGEFQLGEAFGRTVAPRGGVVRKLRCLRPAVAAD